MIRNWYNQIPHPALKTKREITKYINWRQFTKSTRGKPNEQVSWSMYLVWVGHLVLVICRTWHKSVILKSVSHVQLCRMLYKSKSIKSVCFPVCMFLAISSTSITNWVSQDLFSPNPCCSSNSMLELATCLDKLGATMCSSTLHIAHVSDIGR